MFIQFDDPQWTLYWRFIDNKKWEDLEYVLDEWEATCLGFLPVECDGEYFDGLLWDYEGRSYVPIISTVDLIFIFVDYDCYYSTSPFTKEYFETTGDRLIVVIEELIRGHRITFTDYQKLITL